MFENGFDAGYVIRHPVFLVTFIIAIPAWIVAFAAQCAAEAQYTSELLQCDIKDVKAESSQLGQTDQ